MLVLTENATSAIRALAEFPELPESGGLRITSGEEPQELRLSAAPSPEDGDQVIENGGARVFLESEAAAILDDQVLDAQVDQEGGVKFLVAPQ
jgi:iron-sulfur cluster assembly protein